MRPICQLCLAIVLLLPGSGCRQNQTTDLSKPPARPVQLDRLNAFVGQWDWTTEIKDASGKITQGTGSNSVSWEADKWVLVERFEGKTGDNPVSFVAIWTYDSRADVYPVFIADSFGNQSHGTVAFDPANQLWRVRATTRSFRGQRMDHEETLRFRNPNSMEWSSRIRADGKPMLEISGVARRK